VSLAELFPDMLSPGTRRRREGVLVALVSAGFVAVGLALRDRIPWYATAFFVACAVAGVVSIWSAPKVDRAPSEHLTIDDVGITRAAPGLREHVAWADIERVRIMTTDRGPHVEDLFFVVEGKDGQGCVIGQDLAVRSGLLEALQSRLRSVNNAAVIEAMGSSEKRVLTVWERESA